MLKVFSVISIVSAFASPACDSESCSTESTEEVTLLQYKSNVKLLDHQERQDGQDATGLLQEALVAAGLARFQARNDQQHALDGPWQDLASSLETKVKQLQDLANKALTEFVSLPATDPIWTMLRKGIKAAMYATSQDVREWTTFAEKKDWEGYNKKACAFEGGSTPLPEPGNSTVRPADAFYCGHPAVDWSGGKFGGKPINDLCNAAVGDASKPSLCGKYSDKEIVLGLTVTPDEDSRDVNVMTIDCLLGFVDGDIYYCQKCAGRCNA